MSPLNVRRRDFLRGAGALVTTLLASRRLHAQTQEPAAPNVLFILADDLGWGDLGCYGHPYVQTPNLDRLAQEGSCFRQHYAAAPICSPMRASCLTGHFPARYKIYSALGTASENKTIGQQYWLDPAAPTVSRAFQSAGYATAHIGKWHLGNLPGAPLPTAYGFDYARTFSSRIPTWNSSDPTFRTYSTDILVDESIGFLQAHRAQPWYLNLWTAAVHAPIAPPPEDLALYAGLTVNPADFSGYMPAYLRAAADMHSQMRTYCAAVSALDRGLGRLFDYLESAGLAQNTIVVFAGDNGPETYKKSEAANAGVGSPGRFRGRKRDLYDGGVRTPLIVRWPGQVPAGWVDETSVLGSVDLMPTLCSLASVPLPAGYVSDGEDVSAVWRAAPGTRTKSLYWRYGKDRVQAIRAGRYKLIRNPNGSSTRLFDLSVDPEERKNLVNSQPAVVQSLVAELQAWIATLDSAGTASLEVDSGPSQGEIDGEIGDGELPEGDLFDDSSPEDQAGGMELFLPLIQDQ